MNNNQSAFTLIEVLVSLFLITMISAIMYFSISTSTKSLVNSKKKSSDAYTWFLCDSMLRNYVSNINIPFWANDFVFQGDDNVLQLNYLNGKKEIEIIVLPQNVKLVQIDFFKDTNGQPFGVHIIYNIREQQYELKELLSSFPVGVYGL